MATHNRPQTFVGTLYKRPLELFGSCDTPARCLDCIYCFGITDRNGISYYACAHWVDHRLPASALNPNWPACGKFKKLEV